MSDKNYQALYLKAQKVYAAATACYKELLQYQDVLDADQLKAARAAIEKAKQKCLTIKKKAQAQTTNLGDQTTDPIKITVLSTTTDTSAPLTPGNIIQVHYRLENIALPPDLSINDPYQIDTKDQAFKLQVKANNKAIHLTQNLQVNLTTVNGAVEYSAAFTVPSAAEPTTYSFQLECKGKNGAGMTPTLTYQVAASTPTPIEQPDTPDKYPVKITIESPTPADKTVFYYDRQQKDFGTSHLPFKATIENCIPPASDNNVILELYSINTATNEKTLHQLDSSAIKATSNNTITIDTTIELENKGDGNEEHVLYLHCENEKGYDNSIKRTYFTKGKVCYDIIITDGDFTPVYVTINGQQLLTSYTAQRTITKQYYKDCSQGGNIQYNKAYEQNSGNLIDPEKPKRIGSGQGIPNNVKRSVDFTNARDFFAQENNRTATSFTVNPLVWLINSNRMTTSKGKPTVTNNAPLPLTNIQFNQGTATPLGTAAGRLNTAVAGMPPDTNNTGAWNITNTQQVVDRLGNTVTIQTSQRVVTTTTTSIAVTLNTTVRGWGGNPAIMNARMTWIINQLRGRGRVANPSTVGTGGVNYSSTAVGPNGNMVILTTTTTTANTTETRTTITVQ